MISCTVFSAVRVSQTNVQRLQPGDDVHAGDRHLLPDDVRQSSPDGETSPTRAQIHPNHCNYAVDISNTPAARTPQNRFISDAAVLQRQCGPASDLASCLFCAFLAHNRRASFFFVVDKCW